MTDLPYHTVVNRLKIIKKLLKLKQDFIWVFTHYTLGFVIVMSISVISCAASVIYLSTLEKSLTLTFEFEVKGQDYSQKAYTLMLSLENEVKDLYIFRDQKLKQQTTEQLKQDILELRATMKAANSRFYTRAGRDILGKSLVSLDAFIKSLQKLAVHLMDDPEDGASSLLELQKKRIILAKDLNRLIANKTANSYVAYSGLIGQLRWSLLITIMILLITIAIRVAMYLSGRKKQIEPV